MNKYLKRYILSNRTLRNYHDHNPDCNLFHVIQRKYNAVYPSGKIAAATAEEYVQHKLHRTYEVTNTLDRRTFAQLCKMFPFSHKVLPKWYDWYQQMMYEMRHMFSKLFP